MTVNGHELNIKLDSEFVPVVDCESSSEEETARGYQKKLRGAQKFRVSSELEDPSFMLVDLRECSGGIKLLN